MKDDYADTADKTDNLGLCATTGKPAEVALNKEIDSSPPIMTTSAASIFTTDDWMVDSLDDQSNADKWKSFYEHVKHSPINAICRAAYDKTLAAASRMLEQSELDDFKNQTIHDLSTDQQAMLVFMIIKEMPAAFPSTSMAAKVLVKTLRADTPEYKRMLRHVCRSGEQVCPLLTTMEQSYLFLLQKFAARDTSEATTIFQKNPQMMPFLHLQPEEDSYVCTYTACLVLLYYVSYNNIPEQQQGEEIVRTIKRNLSRFIRYEVSGRELANFVLTDIKGAYLDRVLLGVLRCFGTSARQEVVKLQTFDDETFMFFNLETNLRFGHPVAFMIETFPGFANKRTLEFSGKVSDYYRNTAAEREPDPTKRVYHPLLCIGIQPRQGRKSPTLLVQDFCTHRSFFCIGMDLLMDMGLGNLQFCTLARDWRFHLDFDYIADPSTSILFAGSPMTVEDDGIVCTVPEEEPITPRRDIHRYLEYVDTKGPGFVVFET